MSDCLLISNCDIIIEYYNTRYKYVERRSNYNSAGITIKLNIDQLLNKLHYHIRIQEKNKIINYFSDNMINFSSYELYMICIKEYECKITIKSLNDEVITRLSNFFIDSQSKRDNIHNENYDISNKLETSSENYKIAHINIDKLFDEVEKNERIYNKDKHKQQSNNVSTPTKKKINNNNNTPIKLTTCKLMSPLKQNGSIFKSPNKILFQTSPKKINEINISINSINVLNKTQLSILEYCKLGHSVFFSGGAGTGKTHLLSFIIQSLQSIHGEQKVFITATTGLAASAIGGITIHQFAGLKAITEEDDKEEVISEILNKPKIVQRWRDVKALIIDEVSMLNPFILEILQELAYRIRGNNHKSSLNKSFCGIQLIATGDFYQLPPITKKAASSNKICSSQISLDRYIHSNSCNNQTNRFCFQSNSWKSMISKTFLLDQIYRQSDNQFIKHLQSIRLGEVTDELIEYFNSCVDRDIDISDDILPTRLFTHRCDVDIINCRELSNLPGSIIPFQARDIGEKSFIQMLESNCSARSQLHLKIRAQVILVKTISSSEGLVNGARGVVIKFNKESNRPVVRFTNGIERTIHNETFSLKIAGKTLAKRSQLPLDLAWALSIHKSQGMTLDKAIIDLRRVFECGQTYVALSRVRNIQGLSLVSRLRKEHIISAETVKEFYNNTNSENNS